MNTPTLPEVWLRGPLADVPLLLQPVAHALLQAREEVMTLMEGFPEELLWKQPAEVASPGFHLQHLTGVLDRLFTYAKGQSLDDHQLAALAAEGYRNPDIGLAGLLQQFSRQVDLSIRQLEGTIESELTQVRQVGRKKIHSTVLGLLFHAAEHTMRHTGQLLVTVRFFVGRQERRGNLPVKGGVCTVTIIHSNSGKSERFWKNCFILSVDVLTRIVKASKCCMISIMGFA